MWLIGRDTIKFGYAIDDWFREPPSEIERALHCLFRCSEASDEMLRNGSALPVFRIEVSVNNGFLWDNICYLDVFREILTSRSGVFRPFDVACGCPECEEEVSEIRSENDGEIICWSMADDQQPGRLFEDWPAHDCRECGQQECPRHGSARSCHYCFSTEQFAWGVLDLTERILAVYNLGEASLGGALPVEEQKKLIAAHADEWGWRDHCTLEEDWSEYHWLRENAQKLAAAARSVLEKKKSASASPRADAVGGESVASAGPDCDRVDDEGPETPDAETPDALSVSAAPPVPVKPSAPPVLYFAPGDAEPAADDLEGVAPEVFQTLRDGMFRQTLVSVIYSTAAGETRERKILPEILVRQSGVWYCAGFCTLREERRTFRLDRIGSCMPTDTTAPLHGIAAEVKREGLFGESAGA